MSGATLAGKAPWLDDANLQALLKALRADGEEARIAGGAIRNTLLGEPVADIDIATTVLPEITAARAERAGFKVVPTGLKHGTVTVVAGGKPYEVTTLRADVETDGRHAKVAFGRDWQADAERRDFTLNALYADADGTVVDFVGGLADLESRTLRFIGDPEARIREDYLRILRFFRFFAWYGRGRPDAEGLKACARLKDGLEQLSAERVWSELRKLLAAPDPSRALLWMRQSGVLSKVLPESDKWGIDAIHGLVATEHDLAWPADSLLRLEAIVPPDPARMAELGKRLRLSNSEAERLVDWALSPPPGHDMPDRTLRQALYGGSQQGIVDRLRLSMAAARARANDDGQALSETAAYSRLLKQATAWRKPHLPVKGADLAERGFSEGPEIGRALKQLEQAWIESDFSLGRDALLERAAAIRS